MKFIDTEVGFGIDNINILKEIDYITELEKKYLYNRKNKREWEEKKNVFQAEMIRRGVINEKLKSIEWDIRVLRNRVNKALKEEENENN